MPEEKPSGQRINGGGKSTASDVLEPKAEPHHMIPVWFFVGVLLFIFGILIVFSGLMEWSTPPTTVLGNLHAPVWWGAILVIIGLIFVLRHNPRKS